jgi:hypothetical protein
VSQGGGFSVYPVNRVVINVEVNGWITIGDRKEAGCSATPSRPSPTWADRAGVPLAMELPEGRR